MFYIFNFHDSSFRSGIYPSGFYMIPALYRFWVILASIWKKPKKLYFFSEKIGNLGARAIYISIVTQNRPNG